MKSLSRHRGGVGPVPAGGLRGPALDDPLEERGQLLLLNRNPLALLLAEREAQRLAPLLDRLGDQSLVAVELRAGRTGQAEIVASADDGQDQPSAENMA
jgi:hypothetical protein